MALNPAGWNGAAVRRVAAIAAGHDTGIVEERGAA